METRSRTKTKFHTGLFRDKESAESAYNAAIERGYTPDDISLFMSEDTRNKYFKGKANKEVVTETGDKSMEGLAIGGALGGTTIGVLGALLALSSTIVVPGVGLVIAGPLAAGLVGAGAGSIAGGIVGALIGAGIPEERAHIYENGIKDGGIIVSVDSNGKDIDDSSLMADWKKYQGRDIY